MHVEVVTNVIPGMNDDDDQLRAIANWIREGLDEFTPWHITRYYPRYHKVDAEPTPVATLERAYDIGKGAGLKFVYTGNVPGHEGENTVCYSCGNTVIQRVGYSIRTPGLNGSRCRFCGADLNIRATPGAIEKKPEIKGGTE
jgi:pyruvate formate lyase activating enzyme